MWFSKSPWERKARRTSIRFVAASRNGVGKLKKKKGNRKLCIRLMVMVVVIIQMTPSQQRQHRAVPENKLKKKKIYQLKKNKNSGFVVTT